MSPRLAFAVETAWLAGRSTLALFQGAPDVELKTDASPVTAADRQAEEIIRRRIEQAFPGETVLGEEQGLTGASDDRWVIDPIDGTKSFVAGVPLYATLLSYEVDGRPVIGVCCFPALNEILYAQAGHGTFWNGRPARVSAKSGLRHAIVCSAGHRGMENHGRTQGLLKIAQKTMATRTWCDAYGHALVATGRVEAMLDPIVSRWDVSAMIPIIEEAGGRCTGFDGGDPMVSRHPDGELELVSSNGPVHDELLGAFRG
ncbi:MAG: hypothetical protein MH204_11765 [Fimbriimonadaceae bacterium]|nr:hypothetical protein [Fimbriimonadaceae bacterium]